MCAQAISDWTVSEILRRQGQEKALGAPGMTERQVGAAVSGALDADYRSSMQQAQSLRQYQLATETQNKELEFRREALATQTGLAEEQMQKANLKDIGQLAVTGLANYDKIGEGLKTAGGAISKGISYLRSAGVTDTVGSTTSGMSIGAGDLGATASGMSVGSAASGVDTGVSIAQGTAMGAEAAMGTASAAIGAEAVGEAGLITVGEDIGMAMAGTELGLSMSMVMPYAAPLFIALSFIPGFGEAMSSAMSAVGDFASNIWDDISSWF
jgi:hypothetical protein